MKTILITDTETGVTQPVELTQAFIASLPATETASALPLPSQPPMLLGATDAGAVAGPDGLGEPGHYYAHYHAEVAPFEKQAGVTYRAGAVMPDGSLFAGDAWDMGVVELYAPISGGTGLVLIATGDGITTAGTLTSQPATSANAYSYTGLI